jgi:hypothetical protein
VREWQGSALAFAGFEFSLRFGSLLIGARRGSPMLAVGLLSASGVIIAVASIARFLHAGHSSILHLALPAGRLLALATALLLPAAAALYTGHQRLGILACALAIAGYYAVVLRTEAASRILFLRPDPAT